MLFRQLFDPETGTYTYLLGDEKSREAVLIDPVREQVDRDRQLIEELELKLVYTLETHVHADHVTGASLLREQLGSQSVVAAHGGAACGDIHVQEGDRIEFGQRALEVRTTPGHTDGCLTFVLDDRSAAFTGDALLIRGTGRTDFQSGDPRRLYRSIHDKIFSLPDDTKLYPGHDYKGRTVTTVGEEKRFNPRAGGGKTEDEFVRIMNNLDLADPKRIAEAVPANLNCGIAPADAESGQRSPLSPISSGTPREVDPRWVYDNREGLFLVDVRQPEEFSGELGRIPGATLVPLGSLPEHATAWDMQRPIVTICRAGGRSLRAAQTLLDMGFSEVGSMAGGMLAYDQLGLPKLVG